MSLDLQVKSGHDPVQFRSDDGGHGLVTETRDLR